MNRFNSSPNISVFSDDNSPYHQKKTPENFTNTKSKQKAPKNEGKIKQTKSVRFADPMCLQVHYKQTDAITTKEFEPKSTKTKICEPKTEQLRFLFQNPISNPREFESMLNQNKVLLEQVNVTQKILSGTIRVVNLAYEKNVAVIITFNKWKSFEEIKCKYIFQHNYQKMAEYDRFEFSFEVPFFHLLEFCISAEMGESIYWDNNYTENYKISNL